MAGMLGGFTLMVLLTWLVLPLRPTTVNRSFRVLQLGSASFMAFAHGSNDAQKAMGIITLALVSAGHLDHTEVPNWVILSCALAIQKQPGRKRPT